MSEGHPSTDTSGVTVCPVVGCVNERGAVCDARPRCGSLATPSIHQSKGHEISTTYDSRPDTWEHIREVQRGMRAVYNDLAERAAHHDRSKLVSPEVEVFNEYTPKLKDSTYGSPEYASFLEGMGEGLRHHYAANDHHPEHFPNGIADMNLMQVTEMLCDWMAAVQRHDDGDIRKSIEINAERFGYGDEMKRLLLNTVDALEAVR